LTLRGVIGTQQKPSDPHRRGAENRRSGRCTQGSVLTRIESLL
jgi:hypothetical protein